MSNRLKASFRLWCGLTAPDYISGLLACVSVLAPAAASAAPVEIHLPPALLGDSLIELSRQTETSFGFAGALPQLRTRGVHGRMEPGEAIAKLLSHSGLRAVRIDRASWRIERSPPKRPTPPERAPHPPARPRDIIVTARKRAEYLDSAPVSIGVVSAAVIADNAGGRGTSDLLAQTQGAFTTNLGPGRDRIFLRGVADSSFNGPTQSTVSLFLDDARVSYATPDPDLRLVDVSRLEVLRGPQGTLYGTGALGGIVRIVTNRPDLGRWSGEAAVEGSAVAAGGVGGGIEGVLNAPLVQNRLGVRIVGYSEILPGWIDDTARGMNNVNRVDRSGGRADLRWKPAPDWTIDLSLTEQWINARDSQYATSGMVRATALAEPHDNDFLVGRLEVRGRLADLDLLSTSAVVTHEVDSRFDAGAVAAARALATPLAYEEARKMTLMSQEMRLSDPAARRPWVVGISALDVENSNSGTFRPPAGEPVVARDLHDRSFEVALFGEATQPLGSTFDLTMGVRGFLSATHSESGPSRERRAAKIGVTPSATLAWRPVSGRLFWIRYASAVRPGGLNGDGNADHATFRSDELKSVELGSRLAIINRKLSLNATLFALHWESLQSDVLAKDGLPVTINAGNATNFGAEVGATLTMRRFVLDGGITTEHGRLEGNAPTIGLTGDRRLPVVPDYSGHLKLSVAQPVGGLDATAYVGARYVGRARLSFDPALARSMGNYAVVDAGVGLGRQRWRAALGVTNILNGRGDSFGFGNPFSIRVFDQRTPIRPRTATLRIERKI